MEEKLSTSINKKEAKKKSGKRPASLYFPRNSLKDSLRVPKAIWESNAGKPFAIGDLSTKLDYSPMSANFRELIRSSERYGLTDGTWKQNVSHTISLSDLGLSIVSPKMGEDVNVSLLKALTNASIFKRVLESINGLIIPPSDVFKSTLIRDYHLSKEDADACYKIIMQNVQDYKVYSESSNNRYLRLDKLSSVQISQPTEQLTKDESEEITPQISEIREPIVTVKEVPKPKVFISYSKNTKILGQIKQILEFGGFDFVIAEEQETTSIPISDKIFGAMKDCNCGLINISADEQEKRNDGSFGINSNVLIEIGAAFLKYDKRVILLMDRRVTLPTNLKGLYACYYQGDELPWDVFLKLQKPLTEFRKTL